MTGFDTTFDDWRDYAIYFEADCEAKVPTAKGTLPGCSRIGGLRDPRTRREYDTGLDPGDLTEKKGEDFHAYFSFDRMLDRRRSSADAGLVVFGRCGYCEPDVNRITPFASTGLQYRGLLPRREADVLGVARYVAYLSDDYDAEQPGDLDREIGAEFYYSVQVAPWRQPATRATVASV